MLEARPAPSINKVNGKERNDCRGYKEQVERTCFSKMSQYWSLTLEQTLNLTRETFYEETSRQR